MNKKIIYLIGLFPYMAQAMSTTHDADLMTQCFALANKFPASVPLFTHRSGAPVFNLVIQTPSSGSESQESTYLSSLGSVAYNAASGAAGFALLHPYIASAAGLTAASFFVWRYNNYAKTAQNMRKAYESAKNDLQNLHEQAKKESGVAFRTVTAFFDKNAQKVTAAVHDLDQGITQAASQVVTLEAEVRQKKDHLKVEITKALKELGSIRSDQAQLDQTQQALARHALEGALLRLRIAVEQCQDLQKLNMIEKE